MQEHRPNGNDKPLGSLFVTLYMLGSIVGDLLFGLLTDLVGRIYILRGTMTFFLLFIMACAMSPSLPMLITFRVLAACLGGGAVATGGGVVADLYESGERTRPMAWYSVGMMLVLELGNVSHLFKSWDRSQDQC
jgi:MFS family permease